VTAAPAGLEVLVELARGLAAGVGSLPRVTLSVAEAAAALGVSGTAACRR
jgi:hypothetical protein